MLTSTSLQTAKAALITSLALGGQCLAAQMLRCVGPEGQVSYAFSCPTGHKPSGLNGKKVIDKKTIPTPDTIDNTAWHYSQRRSQRIVEAFSYKIEGHVTDAAGQIDQSCYWRGKVTGVSRTCGEEQADLTLVKTISQNGHEFICRDGTRCMVARKCEETEGTDYATTKLHFIGPHMKNSPSNDALLQKIEDAVKNCQNWMRPTAETFRPETYNTPKRPQGN